MRSKHNKCPYQTGDNKCIHKFSSTPLNKRKRVCIYSNPSKCELFCEWVEIVNDTNNQLKTIPAPIVGLLNHIPSKTRPKRCTVCEKIITQRNKSMLCSYHQKKSKYIKVKERIKDD